MRGSIKKNKRNKDGRCKMYEKVSPNDEKLFSPSGEPRHLSIIPIIKRHVCKFNDSLISTQLTNKEKDQSILSFSLHHGCVNIDESLNLHTWRLIIGMIDR
jgi:hypothetical protein